MRYKVPLGKVWSAFRFATKPDQLDLLKNFDGTKLICRITWNLTEFVPNGYIHIYTTFEWIEQESPGRSGFVANLKPYQTWPTGTFQLNLFRSYVHTNTALHSCLVTNRKILYLNRTKIFLSLFLTSRRIQPVAIVL